MKLAGEEPATLNAIVITHEHQDHVNGLAVTARKPGIPVYFTEGTHRAWMRWLQPRRQMSYAQWLEMVRKQAAERRAEPESTTEAAENDRTRRIWKTRCSRPRLPHRIRLRSRLWTRLRTPLEITGLRSRTTPPGFACPFSGE